MLVQNRESKKFELKKSLVPKMLGQYIWVRKKMLNQKKNWARKKCESGFFFESVENCESEKMCWLRKKFESGKKFWAGKKF